MEELSVVDVRLALSADRAVVTTDRAVRSSDAEDSGDVSSVGGLPLSRLLGMAG